MANKYSPYPGDIVDAKLEPGEYVLNRNAVKEIGVKKLNKLNNQIAPRFPKGYQTGGQAFEDLPEYADNSLIEKARQMVHKAKMSYHAKRDPQLKAYLEGSGIDWQGAIAEGQSASKFLEDNGGSSDNFDSTESTRFTRGPLKGATLSDRFTEDVVDGDYSKAKVNNDFLLKTKKHPAGYDLEQYKMFGKVKRQSGGLMSKIHLGLDGLGMIPGVGVPADILNSALYGGEALLAGDPLERKEALSLMGLSAASAIPFLGQGATAGKYAHKINKAGKAYKNASKVTPADRAIYRRALQKADEVANPKYNKWMRDAHVGGKNPYKYDKPKFADPRNVQKVNRSGVDEFSGLPVKGHPAGFQEGGSIIRYSVPKKSIEQQDDGFWKAKVALKAETDDGPRFYGGEERGNELQNSVDEATMVALQKFYTTPEDSIRAKDVRKYLKQNKGSLKSLLGFQKGGKIGPGEQARLEAEHMLQAQQMAKFDQYKADKGIPMSESEKIGLPTSPGAQFSTEDFDKYLGQYADLNDLNNSKGVAPWEEGYGDQGQSYDDYEYKGGKMTPAQQLVQTMKTDRYMKNVDPTNPIVKKLMKDNPNIGLEYMNRMDEFTDSQSNDVISDIELAKDTKTGAILKDDQDYLDLKNRQKEASVDVSYRRSPEESAEILEGIREKFKPQDMSELKGPMKIMREDSNDPYETMEEYDKREADIKRGEENYAKLTNSKAFKKAKRKRKRAEFFNKVKKKIGTFDDAKAGFKKSVDARKKYNEEKMKKKQMQQGGFLTRMQKGGYMRPDGKQGYFAGALVAAAPALMGALGLGGGAASAGAGASMLGKLGTMGGNIGGNYLEAGKSLGKLGNMSMGEGKGNAGSFLGDMLQHASTAQGFPGPKSNQEAVKLTGINSDDSDDVAAGRTSYGSVIDATAEPDVEREPVMTQQEGGYIGSLEGFIQQSWRNMR